MRNLLAVQQFIHPVHQFPHPVQQFQGGEELRSSNFSTVLQQVRVQEYYQGVQMSVFGAHDVGIWRPNYPCRTDPGRTKGIFGIPNPT